MPENVTQRFSNRVEAYVRARPGYPAEFVDTLEQEAGLTAGALVADLGAGTGISSELFLERGYPVLAIEPNAAMRQAAEERLSGRPGYTSLDATAEATGLPDTSVDLILAAQAFHWFNQPAAKQEFTRILRPDGVVALLWNSRLTDATPFLQDYDALLQEFGTDYQQVNHQQYDTPVVQAFYAPRPVERRVFPNAQCLDRDGLRSRLLSASYVPPADDPRSRPMLDRLDQIFDRHAQLGIVELQYETVLFFGRW
jgi:SAM-dependent methyltransferase